MGNQIGLTPAELALLSLVAEQDRYGYEIEGVIEARGMRNWTEIGFSSIYYLLRKLERKGLVRGEEKPHRGAGKTRVVYSILPEGSRALRSGVHEALANPQPAPPVFLLGLANLPLLERDQVLEDLDRYLTGLDLREQSWLEDRRQLGELPYFVQAMFEYSQALLDAEREWVRTFRARLEEENGEDRSQA
jgi:DNA-binding PadR family transcriptional regulator